MLAVRALLCNCEKRGFDRVFVHCEKGGMGKLGKPGARVPSRHHTLLFSEILDTLRAVEEDLLFVVGTLVFAQVCGLPMGHAISPILCQILLEYK